MLGSTSDQEHSGGWGVDWDSICAEVKESYDNCSMETTALDDVGNTDDNNMEGKDEEAIKGGQSSDNQGTDYNNNNNNPLVENCNNWEVEQGNHSMCGGLPTLGQAFAVGDKQTQDDIYSLLMSLTNAPHIDYDRERTEYVRRNKRRKEEEEEEHVGQTTSKTQKHSYSENLYLHTIPDYSDQLLLPYLNVPEAYPIFPYPYLHTFPQGIGLPPLIYSSPEFSPARATATTTNIFQGIPEMPREMQFCGDNDATHQSGSACWELCDQTFLEYLTQGL